VRQRHARRRQRLRNAGDRVSEKIRSFEKSEDRDKQIDDRPDPGQGGDQSLAAWLGCSIAGRRGKTAERQQQCRQNLADGVAPAGSAPSRHPHAAAPLTIFGPLATMRSARPAGAANRRAPPALRTCRIQQRPRLGDEPSSCSAARR